MLREPVFDGTAFEPEPDDVRPLRRPRPFGRARLAAGFVLASALIAGLTLAARDRAALQRAGRDAPVVGAAAEPVFTSAAPVDAAGPLLALDGDPAADGDGGPAQGEPPRWSAATGLREDTLVRGSFDGIAATFLRITLSDAAAPDPVRASLFVTLARRAAEARGLSVVRTGLRGVLDTKFGRFETVEAVLGGEGTRLCTGFASLETRALRIDGWLCGLLGQAPDPHALACTLDGLRLGRPAPEPVEAAFETARGHRLRDCAPRGETTGSIVGGKPVGRGRNRSGAPLAEK